MRVGVTILNYYTILNSLKSTVHTIIYKCSGVVTLARGHCDDNKLFIVSIV